MKLVIQSRRGALSADLRERLADRVRSALGRLAPRVRRIVVRVDAPTAPDVQGAVRALVQVVPARHGGGTLLAESVSGDVLGSVSRAAERAARQLRRVRSRWLGRRRARR